MHRKYKELKSANPDSLLLFKIGDFYELFFGDAEAAAKTLGLTITTRNRKGDAPMPMCGFPYHHLDTYLENLVNSGFKVAVCEQA